VLQSVVFAGLCAVMAWLWPRSVNPGGFPGQVEAIETRVASRDDGLITNLWVVPFQEVKAGDLLAEVITTDPRTVNNRLEVMRDRMRLTQLEMDPVLNRQRGALTYEQLAVDCAKEKVALAVAQVNLERAQSQLKRDEQLFQGGILAKDLYELSGATTRALMAEVAERTQLVSRTEKALERLAFMADAFLPGGENDPLKQALSVEEEKIKIFEAKIAPLRLTAPTGGVVTAVYHHAGEQITAGETVVAITTKTGERIIGYVPEGYPGRPELGMEVEVTTRGFLRQRGKSAVSGVSPRLEPVTNSLVQPVAVRPAAIYPYVRVITITMPAGLELAPGQPVDLRLVAP
jgi:multidrug resistance efflux pump